MAASARDLETRRAVLLLELARTPDMRPGSITEAFRRCGKDFCRCARKGDRGHGPYFAYTLKVDGRTRTIQLREGPLLDRIRREVSAYRRFRETCQKLVEVSQALCEARASRRPA
ncbi:MAG: DUF6788 family protein [Acidobacteriota bacterium]